MKKLLFIILCLFCITGCSDEAPKQEQPNVKQEEQVEEHKYITIKLDINKDCSPKVDNSCKVTKFTVENDKDNIFKDLDLNDSYYCDPSGSYCKKDIENSSTLNKIYEIAIQYNMNLIPDFRYLVNDDYKQTREIVIKPLEDLKWEEKINLNENIVAQIETVPYNEYKSSCMTTDENYGKELGNIDCTVYNGAKKKISDELVEQIKNTIGRSYKGKKTDDLGYEMVIMSKIYLLANPRLYRENNYNILGSYPNSSLARYGLLYNDYITKMRYNPFDIDSYDEELVREYKILDEQTCEEYNLVCDRW